MTQEELYELAGKLTDKEIVYLVCSHLEHIKKAEFGGQIDCGDRVFSVNVNCKLKLKSKREL